MILTLAFKTLIAFTATLTFSTIFNIPKSELLFCGITGAVGFLISQLTVINTAGTAVMGAFLGTLALTVIGRRLSIRRKMPVLVYLIGGILPLVPGSGIYYTMYELVINDDFQKAFNYALETAKVTGAIAISIMSVLSLPRALFDFPRAKKK